jgi:tetratricopeptide (TPR) repeat protein
MPSLPSPRRLLLLPEARRRDRRYAFWESAFSGSIAAPILAVWLATSLACSSAPPPQPPPVREPVARAPEPLVLDQADRSYLIDPLEGYSASVDPDLRDRVRNVWRDLLEEGDTQGAVRVASGMLEDNPDFFPAQVLIAQVDFAAGDHRRVVDRLLPVGDALPTYTASQLLIGRAAERLGDVPLAYAAFRAVAARSPLALKRAGELHPRALEIVANRLDEAVRSQDAEAADQQLALLRNWGPSETLTYEAARKVAQLRGDRTAELAAIKELSFRRPNDQALRDRRADLELQVGDPSAGLKIVQEEAARHPKDPAIAQKLDSAKFRWRLSQLPRGVQEVAAKSELNKGDLAVLLYWLVPEVRNSRPSSGRIATDVLDNPHQEEIVRVVNLGLMDVDPTLHRFSPGSPVRRGVALRVIVRTLAQFGKGACAGGANTCEASVSCGLLPSEEDCQASAPLSGSEGVEIIRRSLKLLGGS